MSKEVIELQKEVVKFLNTISDLMFSNDFAVVKDLKVTRRRAKAVLALLEKQPKCETCGGSGKVPIKNQSCGCIICTCEDDEQCQGCGAVRCEKHKNVGIYIPETEPCPDCQPETGDIYDGLLSTSNAIVAGEEHIIIDRQAAKIKWLEEVVKTKDVIIDELNTRLRDIGGQCFQSAKGKADCCIATQAENE